MSSNQQLHDEAVVGGHDSRESGAYRISFGLEGLNFRNIEMQDPVPTGRQILAGAGLDHRADYILYACLNTGEFEDVRLDETFDLRSKGAERFIAFKSDRDFKFSLNDRQLAWGRSEMLGSVLYSLADASPEEAVFLEVRGGTDQLIEPDERVNLDAPGIERFITAPKPHPVQYEIFVNGKPRKYHDEQISYEDVVRLAFPEGPFDILYTVVFANLHGHDGTLAPGQSTAVHNGMEFRVRKTNRS